MWQVKLTKTPIINDFREGYFPRKFATKKQALDLKKEILKKRGDAIVETTKK